MSQLDLFRDSRTAAPGVIQPFPITRQQGLLAEILRGLFARTEKEGRKFWKMKVREIRRDLKNAGVTKNDIDLQISALVRAVQTEMDYRPHHWQAGQ
ncbi:DUF6074 family protein [Mesorhizobium sp. M0933]|uniref:DUF6074 family protein n=1 Tax=Mesorhizobium sp. M0933 TaxID=2957030 RepID=UPI00333CE2DA